MKLSELKRPFICAVIREPDPPSIISAMKLSECDGAHAFELNLAEVSPEYRNSAALKGVFRSTVLPIFTTCRRYVGRMVTDVPQSLELGDESRMELQLALIDYGSVGFDMELDTYNPFPGPSIGTPEGLRYSMNPASPPREVSHDPEAVAKQARLVEEMHRRGGEVMASSHCLTRLSAEGAVEIGRIAEARGCDLLKIVRFNQCYGDIVETLAATVALRRALRIPYVMMAMGEYGKMIRLLSPLLGSMLCYCKHTYSPGAFTDQPLIRSAKMVFENIDYTITKRAEDFELRAEEVAGSVALT